MVVANKCDMATPEQISEFKQYVESKGYPFFEISAATTQGTRELVQKVYEEIEKLPPIKYYEPQPLTEQEIAERESKYNSFDITVENGVYYIDAPFLEPVLMNADMEDYESLQYFQRVLRSSGIIDKLEEMGINEGDTVSIYDFEFDYVR
jgi:GTP-binding protein